jgi:hypothetical protein
MVCALSLGPSSFATQYTDRTSATYVAATIHVRIAATRASSSEAHDHLRTCLRVFDQNSATNYAVRKASIVIEALMKRMNVSVTSPDTTRSGPSDDASNYQAASTSENASDPRESVATYRGSTNLSPYHQSPSDYNNPEPTMVAGQFVPGLDVDTIIHSFMQEQQFNQADTAFMPMMNNTTNTHQMGHDDGDLGPVQGSMNNGGLGMFDDTLFGFNASGYDWYQPNAMHS